MQSENPLRTQPLVSRVEAQRLLIQTKPALRYFYAKQYAKFGELMKSCPDGRFIEIGSGPGDIKSYLPSVETSDVFQSPWVDRKLNALKMDLEDESVAGIFLLNTFHHIPDVEIFLGEVQRCLKPGGQVLIIDQHVSLLSKWILKYGHHEQFDQHTESWSFQSDDPLISANGALCWMVFKRDEKKFKELYPNLRLVEYAPHTPLFYWMSGGLRKWSLIPETLVNAVERFDQALSFFPDLFCSFVDVYVTKSKN
jgi:SAM-dependent methyltransferase